MGITARVMESSYSIEPQEKLLRLKVWGELTADGLIELLNRARADPRYSSDMGTVADYREAYGDWDYSDIQRLRDYILQLSVPREVRWAAVLKPGGLVATGHVLIVISEALGTPIKMKMFEDPQQALRWVRDGEV